MVYTVEVEARGLATPGTRIADEERGTAYPVTAGAAYRGTNAARVWGVNPEPPT